MSVAVNLPDILYDQLHDAASEQGCTPDVLAERLISKSLAASFSEEVRAITRARIMGERPPKATDWATVEKELSESDPYFDTLEDAMGHLRGRAWQVGD